MNEPNQFVCLGIISGVYLCVQNYDGQLGEETKLFRRIHQGPPLIIRTTCNMSRRNNGKSTRKISPSATELMITHDSFHLTLMLQQEGKEKTIIETTILLLDACRPQYVYIKKTTKMIIPSPLTSLSRFMSINFHPAYIDVKPTHTRNLGKYSGLNIVLLKIPPLLTDDTLECTVLMKRAMRVTEGVILFVCLFLAFRQHFSSQPATHGRKCGLL